MISRQGLTNITMVDESGAPVTFKNIYEVLDTFCGVMSDIYELYKNNKIKTLEEDMEKLELKYKLVRKVIDKEWNFVGLSKKQKDKDLAEFGIPGSIFTSISGEAYTEYGAEELLREYNEKSAILNTIKETDHLEEWIKSLTEFYDELKKRKEYKKLDIHEYPIIECDFEDLISGKVFSPYEL